MQRIRGLLHPTDFSEVANHAFAFACVLAQDFRVPIYVLHVSTGLDAVKGERIRQQRSEQYLAKHWEKLEAIAAADVEIRRALEEGDPAEQILRFAGSHPCDLIIMGTRGRSGLNRLVMGSVAEHVIRRACVPVITLRGAFPAVLLGY